MKSEWRFFCSRLAVPSVSERVANAHVAHRATTTAAAATITPIAGEHGFFARWEIQGGEWRLFGSRLAVPSVSERIANARVAHRATTTAAAATITPVAGEHGFFARWEIQGGEWRLFCSRLAVPSVSERIANARAAHRATATAAAATTAGAATIAQ